MGNFIEFNWEKKYLLMIGQALLMSFKLDVYFFGIKEYERNYLSALKLDIITECCISLSIFIYIIEKCRIKNKKIYILNIEKELKKIRLTNKIIKKYDIYILPKSSLRNICLILFLISITGLFKIFFIYIYFACLNNYYDYNKFLNTYFSAFISVNTLILSLIKAKISKKKILFT